MSDFNNKENFPKVVGKIDLSKLKEGKKEKINFEKISVFLKKGMNLLSNEVNNEYADYGPVLEEDATIKMDEENIDYNHDKTLIETKEYGWAQEKGESLEEWREKREKNPAFVIEMMVILLLHHKLKDKFLVSKASTFDDYENGVDYVLMNKKTGAIICGFDQVLGMLRDDGVSEKISKIQRLLKNGGATLKYGLTIDDDFEENNDLIRTKIKNIPAFFLGISKENLDKMLLSLQKEGVDGDFSEDVFDKNEDFKNFSQSVLNKMIASLEEQYIKNREMLEEGGFDNKKNIEELLKNFDKFKESLNIIKDKINE